MKKQLLLILGATALCFSSIAQRDPNLVPCATYDAMDEVFKNDPSAKVRYNKVQAQMELEYQNEMAKVKTAAKVAAPIYTIPVVFHIMGPQVVSDQVFINFINYVNNDYSATGSDVSTISPLYSSLYVDAEIRFALAQKDPNGNCTNGIIRHDNENIYWSQTSPAYNYSGSGTNKWPTNKYLNVYIVDCIASSTYSCPVTSGAYIGGYTYLPGTYATNAAQDAIVMLRNQLAQNDPHDSRTISHEIGHWLNLSHIFGNNNCTGTSCGDDGITDTPPTQCHFSTCPASAGGNTCDASGNANVENIMDYSSCPKMFTQGQITKMRTALASSTAGRNNLWSPANLLATGITSGYTCTPVADFDANKVNNCVGNTITFTSASQVGTSGGVSWTFQGGTPATSTATSQAVTYASPGTYSVSLTATNTAGSNTMTKTSYITILNGVGGPTLPSTYDFQGTTLPSSITVTNGNAGSVTWVQNTATGGNSTTKSIYINNASATSTGGHIDIFETPVYDFSNTSAITFSYYYAYAKRLATQADTFKVQYSLDCGGSWSNVLSTPTTAQMAAASGGTTTTAFVPTASQWILKSYISSLLNTLNNKPSVKFRFWFKSDATVGRSNNIYIDQINITGSIATGITELEKSMALSIYPNPTASSATLDFTINGNEQAKINVVDIMGRVMEENTKSSDNDGHVNYTINRNGDLAAGVYIVNIEVNNQRVSKKIIIE
ncbi:MAG: T9SS type A sorting domain-containing protein [Bacteroidetes bacterium]|nr:T9SS type A sorting domain-containing protein [Bacteroidota bacterium]